MSRLHREPMPPPRSPATDEDMRRMAAAVWHQRGLCLLDPETVTDPWLRQAIENEAANLYGARNRRLER